jgi:hypothetical protein
MQVSKGQVCKPADELQTQNLQIQNSQTTIWPALAVLAALILFLSTFQTHVNGSEHPYATDVGEIQNALPRWGLIHRSGYPLYTATGSLFVTLLRLVGIQPAAGASLFSVLWGVITVGLLAVLAQELGASGPAAALGALSVALSKSVWSDASLAEVHTLTLAFSAASLLFAVRFGRSGDRRDLLLLTLFLSQGVTHQRSVVLLAPTVLVIIWPHLRALWRHLGSAIGVALLAPLTYLYMPLRVWTGARWVFGSPGTWEGFWAMVFDNRAERVFRWSASTSEWQKRFGITMQILSDDMLWPLLALGLVGLVLWGWRRERRRESLGLMLAWGLNLLLTLAIWKNRVGDAQLAAILPIMALNGVGLALLLTLIARRSRSIGIAFGVMLVLALTAWGWTVRPLVLSVTRDPSAEAVIATAEQVAPPEEPTTLVAPWGNAYWALTYAQAYRGQLSGLDLVDHNADFRAIVGRGNRLLVLDQMLVVFPVSWWEDRLGRLYLASAAPGVVELSPTPTTTADVPARTDFDLENGLQIRSAALEWSANDHLLLTIHWEALRPVDTNYRVAVHLVAHDPPRDGEDVLTQADADSPVNGWYPTSRWEAGEVVRDTYALVVPSGTSPVGVRVAMYRLDEDGAFINTDWLSLPIPERSSILRICLKNQFMQLALLSVAFVGVGLRACPISLRGTTAGSPLHHRIFKQALGALTTSSNE